MIERIKVFLWRVLNYPRIRIKYLKSSEIREKLNVLTSEQTVRYVISEKSSVSRFGDGEFQMIDHYLNGGNEFNFPVDSFQSFDSNLAKRLHEILLVEQSNFLVCIPYSFKNSTVSKLGARMFWEREWNTREHLFVDSTRRQIYGDTNFTRFYMDRVDISNYPQYLSTLESLWEKQDLLIIEGEMSRLGVGNDLFDSAKSIERILCPSKNAFQFYDEIISKALLHADDKLVLIALGHTATVLAYDLARVGHWAIDIGHIDIEYEWYKMRARKKVVVPNKYVNEVMEGRLSSTLENAVYEQQVIDKVVAF